jgi:hypothetical protein
MYLGSSDATFLAEEISESVKNGQFSQALQPIKRKQLNPIQAMYVMGLINGHFIMEEPLLSQEEVDSFMRVLSINLNEYD